MAPEARFSLPMSAPARSPILGTTELARRTLEEFRRGDAAAFRELMRRYEPIVRGTVARFWRGAFEREDAIQEVWMQVYRNREALDLSRASTFSGWLAVLARRRCIDLLRQTGAVVQTDELGEAAALEQTSIALAAEENVESAELRDAVAAFKLKLKPGWREFFTLHFVEGLDYCEVAARLSISKLRCRYMRKVLIGRARKSSQLLMALGRCAPKGGGDAP